MTGALMLCAFFVDLVVWYKADKITFPEDEAPPCVEMEQLAPSAPLAIQYESTLWWLQTIPQLVCFAGWGWRQLPETFPVTPFVEKGQHVDVKEPVFRVGEFSWWEKRRVSKTRQEEEISGSKRRRLLQISSFDSDGDMYKCVVLLVAGGQWCDDRYCMQPLYPALGSNDQRTDKRWLSSLYFCLRIISLLLIFFSFLFFSIKVVLYSINGGCSLGSFIMFLSNCRLVCVLCSEYVMADRTLVRPLTSPSVSSLHACKHTENYCYYYYKLSCLSRFCYSDPVLWLSNCPIHLSCYDESLRREALYRNSVTGALVYFSIY